MTGERGVPVKDKYLSEERTRGKEREYQRSANSSPEGLLAVISNFITRACPRFTYGRTDGLKLEA